MPQPEYVCRVSLILVSDGCWFDVLEPYAVAGAPLGIPALINFLSFYSVGLPVGSLLAYQAHRGVRGLWSGLVLAVALIVVGQYIYIGVTVDWDKSACAARERALKKDQAGRASESDARGLAAADGAKEAIEM